MQLYSSDAVIQTIVGLQWVEKWITAKEKEKEMEKKKSGHTISHDLAEKS